MDFLGLAGKRLLVFGVANKKSLVQRFGRVMRTDPSFEAWHSALLGKLLTEWWVVFDPTLVRLPEKLLPPLARAARSLLFGVEAADPVALAGIERVQADVEHGSTSFLDAYAAHDEAEFFAVASEVFFEQPGEFARRLPMLYGELRDYYRLDPATWSDR